MAVIEARGLRKRYQAKAALDGLDLTVAQGRVLGLIGPNGAGKSTTLAALVGLTPYEGQLTVLGMNPWTDRDRLMSDVCFIADVSVLPRWIRVVQLLDYVGGVSRRFDRAKAERLLAATDIRPRAKVRALSKGMVTQLHLAIAMAVDAKLLVLDEPTLGLDILYRKHFFDALLGEYLDGTRTIVVTTHQVEEVQNILTDVVFIAQGRAVFASSMEDIEHRFTEMLVPPGQLDAARTFGPVHERQIMGRSALLFDGVARARLAGLGDCRTPDLADLFVALLGPGSRAHGIAA